MKKFYLFKSLLLTLFAALPFCTLSASSLSAGYYYITSNNTTSYSGYAIQATLSGGLTATKTDITGDPVYAAIWEVSEAGSDGTQTIKNLVTGTYIQNQADNSASYTLGTTGYGFTIMAYGSTSAYNVWSTYDATTSGNCRGLNVNGTTVLAWYDASDTGNQWLFTSITLTDTQKEEVAAMQTDLSGTYQIVSYNSTYGVMKESDGLLIHEAASTTTSPEYAATWIVKRTSFDGYYSIQNAQTGRYIQEQGNINSQYTTGTTAHSFYIAANSSQSGYYNIFNSKGGNHINIRTWDTVVLAWTNSDCNSDNCVWTFTDVSSSVTDDGILAARESYLGASAASSLTSGGYYQIYNPARDTYLSVSGTGDDCSLQHLSLKSEDYISYRQYWKVVDFDSGTGSCTLQNVYTGKYMNNIPTNDRAYSAGDTGDTFYIEDAGFSLMPYVHIKQSTSTSWMPHAEAGGAVVNWTAGSDGNVSATEWLFKNITLTDEQVSAAQADYKEKTDAIANASTYNSTLSSFFTDNTCTTLNSTYASATDEALKSAMATAGLPEYLQAIAVAVKNNTWNADDTTLNNYEKQFRIATFKPFSDPEKWRDIIGNGHTFSRLEQPTGIYVKEGDIYQVFAGQAAPNDATLFVEILGENAATGTQSSALKAGLNTFVAEEDGNVFVSYHCDTHTNESSKLTDYPDIKIHIEGGTLNGYFDTRTMTNDNWVAMQTAGLFSCTTLNIVSDKLMFSMDSYWVKKYTPEKICDLVSVWDFIANTEDNLMGANDKYITSFSARCNNVFGMFSVNTGYMYASEYGTYYNMNDDSGYALATVMNNTAMQIAYTNPQSNSSSSGTSSAEASGSPGTLWGPAHENGHLRQGLINIVGDTEVSNNVFSNVCLWERGYSTTRGNSVTTLLNQYNENNSRFYLDFPAGQDGSGCWDRTRMYWQLYLYYEVAGHHKNFYPELFAALRKDPMVRRSGAVTYGYENYLKFAKKCCEVSGDDLTEFFKIYGFFVPVSNRYVADYGDYYITTTQESIDSTLSYMSQFKSGAENIIFIEDRIEYTQAAFDGATATDMRMDYESGVAVGKCGDVGSFTNYTDETKISNYLYTISDGTVTISGTNAVGYKVYDAEGNLVALYNTNSFTLPSSVASGTYTIKAAQADGTCVEIPNSANAYYALKAYYGTSDAIDIYAADKAPTLEKANALFLLDSSTAVNSTETTASVLPTATNVLVKGTNNAYTAANFTLTDKSDFYTPCDFTASSLTYTRSNTAGYNSVCLPFSFTASQLGTDCTIETINGVNSGDAGTIYISLSKPTNQTAAAGEPVIVYCPETVTEWNISGTNANVAASSTATSVNGVTLNGSYVSKTIGEGHYKLNAAGDAFGKTTAAGQVTAFRTWISLAGTSSNAPAKLFITHEGGVSTNLTDAAHTSSNTDGAWYDLSGRRVLHPTHGIYLHGGKKYIFK